MDISTEVGEVLEETVRSVGKIAGHPERAHSAAANPSAKAIPLDETENNLREFNS